MNLDSINWLQAVANLVLCLGGVGGFGLWYKSYIIEAVQLTFSGQLVPREEYREDRDAMWAEINQIKKFDAEFAVLKTQMGHVQQDTQDVKAKVDTLTARNDQRFDDLSAQLTGGLNRLAELTGRLSK